MNIDVRTNSPSFVTNIQVGYNTHNQMIFECECLDKHPEVDIVVDEKILISIVESGDVYSESCKYCEIEIPLDNVFQHYSSPFVFAGKNCVCILFVSANELNMKHFTKVKTLTTV